jgi:hypothetical protein
MTVAVIVKDGQSVLLREVQGYGVTADGFLAIYTLDTNEHYFNVDSIISYEVKKG